MLLNYLSTELEEPCGNRKFGHKGDSSHFQEDVPAEGFWQTPLLETQNPWVGSSHVEQRMAATLRDRWNVALESYLQCAPKDLDCRITTVALYLRVVAMMSIRSSSWYTTYMLALLTHWIIWNEITLSSHIHTLRLLYMFMIQMNEELPMLLLKIPPHIYQRLQ